MTVLAVLSAVAEVQTSAEGAVKASIIGNGFVTDIALPPRSRLTVPIRLAPAGSDGNADRLTGWDACQKAPDTGTVPDTLAVTVPEIGCVACQKEPVTERGLLSLL